MAAEDFQEVKVLVPVERVAEFYEMVGRWLARPADAEMVAGAREPEPWSDDDLALAEAVWFELSQPARDLFSVLSDRPEVQISGEQLAEDLHIDYGKSGIAGVLAWPTRHCKAVGRELPIEREAGPVGESSSYWMTPDIADLFRKARDGK